jgi:2-polyprenyl-3-methyl-5-hydroxy-6-metoxy-1,4-benzoquinol methylase
LIENQICFDFIILKNVLEHVRDPENLISKLKKILVSGGKLVVTVPNVLVGYN